jgi:ADP-ribose pyrophosphatase YjhB (NUDIX family)
MKFCPNCGKTLVRSQIDERERPHCDPAQEGCGFIHFGHYALGVGGVVLSKTGNSVLLIQRNQEPGKGFWTLPGGFVEFDETAESGVVREVEEETGIQTRLLGLVGFRNRVNPRNNDAYVVFLLEETGGALIQTPNEEIANVGFYDLKGLDRLHPLPPISKLFAERAILGQLRAFRAEAVQRYGLSMSDRVFLSEAGNGVTR